MCWLIDNMYVNLQKHMKKSLKIFVAAKFFKFLEFSETRQLGVRVFYWAVLSESS